MHRLRTDIRDASTNFVHPQVEHMGRDYDRDAPGSITRMESNRPLAVAPALASFHLDPETLPTDLVSQRYTYAMGLLVSDRLRAALEPFALPPHQWWPAGVVHQGRARPYAWLHLTDDLRARLDPERTVIEAGGGERVPATGVEALEREVRERYDAGTGPVTPRRLALRDAEPPDLLAIALSEVLYLVSDRLADALRAGGFTGLGLEPSAVEVVGA